jgi:hypothetical protein
MAVSDLERLRAGLGNDDVQLGFTVAVPVSPALLDFDGGHDTGEIKAVRAVVALLWAFCVSGHGPTSIFLRVRCEIGKGLDDEPARRMRWEWQRQSQSTEVSCKKLGVQPGCSGGHLQGTLRQTLLKRVDKG